MADVRIDDLQFSEAELLADSESYIGELSEDELGLVAGGSTPATVVASSVPCAGVAGAAAGAIWGLFD